MPRMRKEEDKMLRSYVKELRSYGVKELSQMPCCRVKKELIN